MTHDFKSFLNGKGTESTNMKQEIFLGILRQSGIGIILYFLICIFIKPNTASFLVAIAFSMFVMLLYFLGRIYAGKESFKKFYTIYCIGYGCVFLPLMYIYGGGIQSGIPILYILSGFVTVLLLDYILMYVVLSGTFAILITLLHIEYTHPAAIHIKTGELIYLYTPFCAVFTGISIGLILSILLRNFKENRKMSNELLRQLQKASVQDALSGVFNRRYLMEKLEEITKKAERGEANAFSLIMIDLDHFKMVNDRYGHLTGDRCIKKTATVAAQIIGDENLIGRYGGEEFLCILFNTDDESAFFIADKIRKAVEKENRSLPIEGTATISCGIAFYSPGKTATDLIKESDSNMYIAKKTGRNRVVWRNGANPPID